MWWACEVTGERETGSTIVKLSHARLVRRHAPFHPHLFMTSVPLITGIERQVVKLTVSGYCIGRQQLCAAPRLASSRRFPHAAMPCGVRGNW
ncbi:hypothetical protein PF002_g24189 [Phytophthora fragariae]|uniref:Uncharacterized protein n=1 Tax=Phytophthora fragariae TaxID=53985 RepID=A0A6A3E089_9STRA|nr:hypothetical protein PF009_g23915 [Phytophthora fragariae]KAE8978985.1 hypothetical protein PF011_g23023 [Phytophthora fragariae]KAE9077881.1 hypothetical protein PF007_g24080 [Phytophthora fragariae]KAE9192480.1 hypothetical protein PF002_g24189 [Phytophthora fragariae]